MLLIEPPPSPSSMVSIVKGSGLSPLLSLKPAALKVEPFVLERPADPKKTRTPDLAESV